MNPVIIPCKCLDSFTTPSIPEKTVQQTTKKPQKSFAQALTSNVYDIPSSQLPIPVIKGDDFSISISKEEYLVGVETCKHNLHGRVIWSKGSTPLTIASLCSKLSVIWKDL
jgi:hypothetical protein